MKQNITLSLEKDLIKRAKILSTKRQTSISQMLGQELKKLFRKPRIMNEPNEAPLSISEWDSIWVAK